MANKARNTTGASQTATSPAANKGDLATMLTAAAVAAPKPAKAKGPRTTFTVTQIGQARLSSTGKSVLVAVSGETEDGHRVGGTLWVKP